MRGNIRAKFACPKCGKSIAGRVTDSDPWYAGIKRYRVCEECGVRFVTVEKVAYISRGCASERKASTEEGI